ncbi:MAG: class I SAM-dependent methyltransferase [Planctomycetota bacterium]
MASVVTREIGELLAGCAPGRLLEIPAGEMPVARALEPRGWRVVGLDLFPPAGAGRCVLADACAPLPFPAATFDAVVSQEGIEHFENQAAFVRECARVLKPRGVLVLTTPNVLHLSARVSAFLTAQRVMKRGFLNEAHTLRARNGSRIYHGHAFLIDAIRLRYLLALEGLAIDAVGRGRRSTGSILLGFLAPAVWLGTRLALASGRRTLRREGRPPVGAEVEAEVRRLANHPRLLFGRKLVLRARRRVDGRASTG